LITVIFFCGCNKGGPLDFRKKYTGHWSFHSEINTCSKSTGACTLTVSDYDGEVKIPKDQSKIRIGSHEPRKFKIEIWTEQGSVWPIEIDKKGSIKEPYVSGSINKKSYSYNYEFTGSSQGGYPILYNTYSTITGTKH
jgi:hypothetical protein